MCDLLPVVTPQEKTASRSSKMDDGAINMTPSRSGLARSAPPRAPSGEGVAGSSRPDGFAAHLTARDDIRGALHGALFRSCGACVTVVTLTLAVFIIPPRLCARLRIAGAEVSL